MFLLLFPVFCLVFGSWRIIFLLYHPLGQCFQPQHYCYFGRGHSFLGGAVAYMKGCLRASLAFTHHVPGAAPLIVSMKTVPRHGHTFPGRKNAVPHRHSKLRTMTSGELKGGSDQSEALSQKPGGEGCPQSWLGDEESERSLGALAAVSQTQKPFTSD